MSIDDIVVGTEHFRSGKEYPIIGPIGHVIPNKRAVPRRDSKDQIQNTKPFLPRFKEGLRIVPLILNREKRFPNDREMGINEAEIYVVVHVGRVFRRYVIRVQSFTLNRYGPFICMV